MAGLHFPPLSAEVVDSGQITDLGTVTLRGDIRSHAWDGGSDLSSGPDANATAGFFLDSSAGAGQFKSLFAEGVIIAAAGSDIDWSYIKNVSIENADIVSLSFDKITAGSNDASLVIGASGSISSANYAAGTAGFIIGGDGNVEFNDGVFRGVLGDLNVAGTVTLTETGAFRTHATTTRAELKRTSGGAAVLSWLESGIEVGRLWAPFGQLMIQNPDQGLKVELRGGIYGVVIGDNTLTEGNLSVTADGIAVAATASHGGGSATAPAIRSSLSIGTGIFWPPGFLAMGITVDGSEVVRFTDTAGHNLQGLPYDDYTPTLTGLSVGSTGTISTARYVRIGDVVHVEIFITLGGTGISVGDVRIQLPFNPAFGTNSPAVGECLLVEAGVGIHKGALNFADNALQVRCLQVSGSSVTIANLSSTTPFTWGDGDSIRISAIYKAA